MKLFVERTGAILKDEIAAAIFLLVQLTEQYSLTRNTYGFIE
ncbi:hypothetical protein F4694_005759 [Bacillus niacini]|uniref:Uncharacterized protein n=1 Tax=Neobacillus niacini TaxID=86668 RepID=A0A852TJH2_9BACI|nr:hypothetical protein [Neobacillus niacini]NYE08902.1 hypothetical protein [Neobacillus niacini]